MKYMDELAVLQTQKKQLDKEAKKCKSEEDLVALSSILSTLSDLNANITLKKKSRSAMAKALVSEKNVGMQTWELNTPKPVRDGAVLDVC